MSSRDPYAPGFSTGQRVEWMIAGKRMSGVVRIVLLGCENPRRALIRRYGNANGFYAFSGKHSTVRMSESYVVEVDPQCRKKKAHVYAWPKNGTFIAPKNGEPKCQ